MSLDTLMELLRFAREAPYRFYQERDLVLDLVHWGWPGLVVGVLLDWQILVFLLAILHAIPERRHVLRLFLGIGLLALVAGALTSWHHFGAHEGWPARIVPYPETEPQARVVVLLPFVMGALTAAVGLLGTLYMAVFWVARRHKGQQDRKAE